MTVDDPNLLQRDGICQTCKGEGQLPDRTLNTDNPCVMCGGTGHRDANTM